MPKTRYKIGTFNLRFGRSKTAVQREVKRAVQDNDLDVLFVQEAASYYNVLHAIVGYTYVCGSETDSHKQVGILVKATHDISRVHLVQAGDGWHTEGGDYHGPIALPQCLINGHLGVKGTHQPTPSAWKDGKLTGPPERIDDLELAAANIMEWFRPRIDLRSDFVKVCGADWNEPPSTRGKFSPHWIASMTNANIHSLPERQWNVDYFLVKGDYDFVKMYQDTNLTEHSDHELRVMVIDMV